MANAKLTRDVKVLSTPGFARNAGRAIGQGEVSPAIWNMWIAEGIVVYDSGTPPTLPEQTIIEDSLPQESSLPKEEILDEQLQKLSFTELKAMGKKMKLKSWHLMKRETLLREIQNQS